MSGCDVVGRGLRRARSREALKAFCGEVVVVGVPGWSVQGVSDHCCVNGAVSVSGDTYHDPAVGAMRDDRVACWDGGAVEGWMDWYEEVVVWATAV